ncbi:hypothetical protein PVAND_000481 [Polypedilum vanderplanki]|uniref:Uncharacterized protein n=1 Tax=Polypedilum vanderplanki TaxID=319348 RepID=A0A9J6BL36_POLVA|nr:hypothetical protein PVAND_000481 [Polypedilum vanderplanki]
MTSGLESEEEVKTPFQTRDLIREYLTKSLVKVPEILKSHHENFATSVTAMEELNLAYKHPLVIAEELQNDAGETTAIESFRKLTNVDNSSIIIPQPRRSRNRSERPHLIGKVTPTIARTWEQLSSAIDNGSVVGDEEEDKQSYVLFVRKPFNFEQNESNEFAVNKIQHEIESEKFYDSIEEYGDDYEEEIDDVDCADDEEEACGGEIMADQIDSLELKRNVINDFSDNGDDDVIVWSIES